MCLCVRQEGLLYCTVVLYCVMLQEGLLDITLLFSDGTETPLRSVAAAQYYLAVDTVDTSVIAFAPVPGHHKDTRVIAVGRGRGELLKVSLELADECHDKGEEPLASALVTVEVDLEGGRGEVQGAGGQGARRRGRGRRRKEKLQEASIKSVNMGDLSEMFSNVPMRDDNSRVYPGPAPAPAHPHQPGAGGGAVSPLEAGMYVLLAVFCLAIATFVASCFVYASKHPRPGPSPAPASKSQSAHAAHDWVWLGRQTLDSSHASHSTHGSGRHAPAPRLEVRAELAGVNITGNPIQHQHQPGPEYGFVSRRGLRSASHYSPDVYAELPRRQRLLPQSPRAARSPRPQPRQLPRPAHAQLSPASSLSSSASGSLGRVASVNSATYTRQRPVEPGLDPILPVGYPVLQQAGFQNPWEALQEAYRSQEQGTPGAEQEVAPHLRLDLAQSPDTEAAARPELRQSPASALPPYSEAEAAETVYSCARAGARRGEYVALNPDIKRATPPRKGASRVCADPFNVSDEEAPPVTSELLSPSCGLFSSVENINFLPSEAADTTEAETEASDTEADNCSSVCSADSEELDQAPSGAASAASVSPAGSLARRRAEAADLSSVPLGSLDYEHLMNYFECLKESAA